MISEFGEAIRPHLNNIRDGASLLVYREFVVVSQREWQVPHDLAGYAAALRSMPFPVALDDFLYATSMHLQISLLLLRRYVRER